MDVLLIIASNLVMCLGVYALGWHSGRARANSSVPEFVDTRKCLCQHLPNSHTKESGCHVITAKATQTSREYSCACKRYIPDPKAELV